MPDPIIDKPAQMTITIVEEQHHGVSPGGGSGGINRLLPRV